MRTISWFTAICSTLVFGFVSWFSLTIKVVPVVGLVNPIIVADVASENKVVFAVFALVLFVAVYTYWFVRWIDYRLDAAKQAGSGGVSLEADPELAPIDVLKDAIRKADMELVCRQLSIPSIQEKTNQDLLTPLELAELYGDDEIIALVGKRSWSYGS